MGKQGRAIRLTNKTAVALRQCAERVKKTYLALGVVITVALTAAAVPLGMRFLPLAPACAAVAVLADVWLATLSRRDSLMLTGQAICTESAARRIDQGEKEEIRRRQAIEDLARVSQDAETIGQIGLMEMRNVPEPPDFAAEGMKAPKGRVVSMDEAKSSKEDAPTHRRRRALRVIVNEPK